MAVWMTRSHVYKTAHFVKSCSERTVSKQLLAGGVLCQGNLLLMTPLSLNTLKISHASCNIGRHVHCDHVGHALNIHQHHPGCFTSACLCLSPAYLSVIRLVVVNKTISCCTICCMLLPHTGWCLAMHLHRIAWHRMTLHCKVLHHMHGIALQRSAWHVIAWPWQRSVWPEQCAAWLDSACCSKSRGRACHL